MALSDPELVLIRHAPADTQGRLCGRTDVPALATSPAAMEGLRHALAPIGARVSSPALRCVQTAGALWPGATVPTDERLREQDFGEWDGLPFDRVPDLGPLSPDDLAHRRPPGGESFADLCKRVGPALKEIAALGESVAVVAHAGTVRAALALSLASVPAALSFDVAPLSKTRLRVLRAGGFAVICVNCRS